jgi:valyl-tRNA synthetase
MSAYRRDLAAQALSEFAWHEFCDWYLEMTKPVLTGDDVPAGKRVAARETLATVLGAILKLLHPVMPFVTEELWLHLCRKTDQESESIMLESLPVADDYETDEEADAEVAWLKAFVFGVRQIRGEMNISPGKRLPVAIADSSSEEIARLETHRELLTALARLERIEIADDPDSVGDAATALVGRLRILVPLAGVIDLEAEVARLDKQRSQAQDDLGKAESKLANRQFVDNAPAEIVAKERARADELRQTLEQLGSQIGRLEEMR